MASFGNIAYGNKEHGAHAIYKWEDQAALKNDDFLYYGSNDFFCAHGSYVSDAMLGGGSANWHGSQDTGTGYRGNNAEDGEIDVQQLAIPKDGAAASQFLMGLSAEPSEEDQGKAMAASDEDVPLAPAPETPVAVLPPEEVPLAMRIPDEDVPLAAVPKTGDNSWIWSLLTLFSAVGLIGLELESRRKKNTEK